MTLGIKERKWEIKRKKKEKQIWSAGLLPSIRPNSQKPSARPAHQPLRACARPANRAQPPRRLAGPTIQTRSSRSLLLSVSSAWAGVVSAGFNHLAEKLAAAAESSRAPSPTHRRVGLHRQCCPQSTETVSRSWRLASRTPRSWRLICGPR